MKDPPLSALGWVGGGGGGVFILIIHLDKYIRTEKIMAVFQTALVYTGWSELAELMDGGWRMRGGDAPELHFVDPQILI